MAMPPHRPTIDITDSSGSSGPAARENTRQVQPAVCASSAAWAQRAAGLTCQPMIAGKANDSATMLIIITTSSDWTSSAMAVRCAGCRA